jgi:hypothetical protein
MNGGPFSPLNYVRIDETDVQIFELNKKIKKQKVSNRFLLYKKHNNHN